MGLLGKVKNKVHQGLLGAKDVYVKLNEFIKDNGLLPYIYAGMAAYAMDMPIEAMQIILPAIGFHQMYKHKEEMKNQENPSDSQDIYKSYNKNNYEVIPANKIIDDSEMQQSTNQNKYMARKPTQE